MAAVGCLGALLGACGDEPTSLLVRVQVMDANLRPDAVQMTVYDGLGVAYKQTQFSVPAGTGLDLGTIVIYPRAGDLNVRIHLIGGRRAGGGVSETVGMTTLKPDKQLEGVLVMTAGRRPDSDGDGVPDAIDNCPRVPNANQDNRMGTGVGDACR